MSSIAVTGTRHGMTIDQWARFGDVLGQIIDFDKSYEFHDGDCVGADSQAHTTVRGLKRMGLNVTMHGHPCRGQGLEKFRAHNEYDVEHAELPPIVRNRIMVDAADVVIAAPNGFSEVAKGSGTWATVRYARLNKKHLVIVWPDGSSSEENA